MTELPVDAAAWGAQVRANRDQAERVREAFEADFYRTTSHRFVVDPRRTDDPSLDMLLALARPGDTWLDIGAGAGRYALPLALHVAEVIAIDPSPAMLRSLRDGMVANGIGNIVAREGRWPADEQTGSAPIADVALMAHVGYDIEEIGPFVDAAEGAARRLCVALMTDRAPSFPAGIVWPAVHGEARIPLPGAREFIALLRNRGVAPSVTEVDRMERTYPSPEEAHTWLRHQCFIAPGGEADRRLAAAVAALPVDDGGRIVLPVAPLATFLIRWAPRDR